MAVNLEENHGDNNVYASPPLSPTLLAIDHDLFGPSTSAPEPQPPKGKAAPEFDPPTTPIFTRGTFFWDGGDFTKLAWNFSLNCDSSTVYALGGLALPRQWAPFMEYVETESRTSRDYYPLPQQQLEFDNWERDYPQITPGSATFGLNSIPTAWEDEIPAVPMPYLIAAAISGTPSGMLTEREIKLALMRRFLFFSQRPTWTTRWQVSVNWILNHYECFEAVECETTPEDDGCAYRVWGVLEIQSLIWVPLNPVGNGGYEYMPQDTLSEVPVHIFLPIDYGESKQDLTLKPRRAQFPPPQQSRKMAISNILNSVTSRLRLPSIMTSRPRHITLPPLRLPEPQEEEEREWLRSPTSSVATTVLCDPFWYLEEGLSVQVITGTHRDGDNASTEEGEESEDIYGEHAEDSEEETDEEEENEDYLPIGETDAESESGHGYEGDLRLPPIQWEESGPKSNIRRVKSLPSRFPDNPAVIPPLGPSLIAQSALFERLKDDPNVDADLRRSVRDMILRAQRRYFEEIGMDWGGGGEEDPG